MKYLQPTSIIANVAIVMAVVAGNFQRMTMTMTQFCNMDLHMTQSEKYHLILLLFDLRHFLSSMELLHLDIQFMDLL